MPILTPMGRTAELFRVTFAVATLFHLAGNPATGFDDRTPWLVPVQAAIGVLAVVVLARPAREGAFLLLAGVVPLSAWLEAPVVGNHWVLASALALTYLLARAVSATRAAESTAALFAPAARVVLLLAYAFAAFSKLNTGFFDPATSCAVYYQDQMVSSWGLPGLSLAGRGDLGVGVAVAAACVELSVPVLLLRARTRRHGVLLAMGFHWFLALDLDQHFWDFSAVLFAAFLLFLDDRQTDALLERAARVTRRVRPSVRLLLATLGLGAAAVATASAALGGPPGLVLLSVVLGHATWWVLGTAVLAGTGLTLRGTGVGDGVRLRSRAVMLLVPAVVVLNGLSPYLELKTGYGWNMYSNLRTVAGVTNHLLVPTTLDLTGAQRDRVQVIRSSDARLTAREDVELVWSEFVEYAHAHPDESVTYRRGGRVHDAPTLADDPATAAPTSQLGLRLQSFRAVDVSGGDRCIDTFGPAR